MHIVIQSPKQNYLSLRPEAFTAMEIPLSVCWAMTLYTDVVGYKRFGEPLSLHLQEDGYQRFIGQCCLHL